MKIGNLKEIGIAILIIWSVFGSLIPVTNAEVEKFWTTAYFTVYENEMDGIQTVHRIISERSYTLKASFLFGGKGVAMQGTGRTNPGGDYIHYNGGGGKFININDPIEFTEDIRQNYANLGITDFTGFGNLALQYPHKAIYSRVSKVTGSSGRALIPWKSIATDPLIIRNNIGGILSFESGSTPNGANQMMFSADDTGGSIKGNRIDIYVGEGKSTMEEWNRIGGNRYVNVSTPKFLTLPFIDPKVQILQGWTYDSGGTHESMDYVTGKNVAGEREPFVVRASADGEAKYVPNHLTWGNYVLIKHIIQGEVYYTRYAHLDSSPLPINELVTVKRGDKIGIAGKTGAANNIIHLHFEFSKGIEPAKGCNCRIDPYYIYSNTKKDYPPYKNSGKYHYWTTDPPSTLIDISISRGLQYLRSTQNSSDGSWSYFGIPSVGITSLAALSFINYGLGETDPTVKKATYWISKQYQPSTGIISYPITAGGRESDDVYDTSMAILTLVATHNPVYNDKIKGATNFLNKSQNDEIEGYMVSNPVYGGWGYPRPNWADLSNSQFAIMALDAAAIIENNKLATLVSKNDLVWSKMQVFLARTQNREENVVVKIGETEYTITPDYNFYNDGGFMYGPGYTNFADGRSYGSMTAAGVWSLLLSNVDMTDPRLSGHDNSALNWLDKQHYFVEQNFPIGNTWVYYYDLTFSKALMMAGAKGWTSSHNWYENLSDFLISERATDGHWPNIEGEESSDILTTSEAILSLEIQKISGYNQRLSWISFILHSNADLHIYDPLGRHVGKNYETGEIDIEIPNATFLNDQTQKINIQRLDPGNYNVKLVGTREGEYTIDIKGGIGNTTISEYNFTSKISEGAIHEGIINVAMITGLTIHVERPIDNNNNITVNIPNGGENLVRGTTKTIRWTSSGSTGSFVKIELIKGGMLNRLINSNTSNDGSYSWTIPSNQTLGNDYKIKITSTSNPIYKDASNNNFIISSPVNLLKNPGFETSYGSLPMYWGKYQTGTKAIFTYPETGRTGGKSAAIKYTTKEKDKVAIWWQPGIVVIPSKQYKLSGYMKLANVTGGNSICSYLACPRYNGASLRVNWLRSNGTAIKVDLITKSGTTTWDKYEKTFTAPSNAVRATVGGDLFNSSGKVWFDDMSFTRIS